MHAAPTRRRRRMADWDSPARIKQRIVRRIAATVEVPPWVPPYWHKLYLTVAAMECEEAAASHVRKLKATLTKGAA